MKNLLLATVLGIFGMLSCMSCNKADEDPYGDFTCVCLITHKAPIKGDTMFIKVNQAQKSTATAFCARTQVQYTDTNGNTGNCKLIN